MAFSRTTLRYLNRLLIDQRYDRVATSNLLTHTRVVETQLFEDDERVIHIKNILSLVDGDSIRMGVVDGGIDDKARIHWNEAGLKIEFDASILSIDPKQFTNHLDVIVAMPSPRNLIRILPLLSSIGVDNIFLTGAEKVDQRFLASHYLQQKHAQKLHDLLRQGLEQSGNLTKMPSVFKFPHLHALFKNIRKRDEEHGEEHGTYVKVLAHPRKASMQRCEKTGELLSNYHIEYTIGDIPFPSSIDTTTQTKTPPCRMLLAIGPNAGWVSPTEINQFISEGFTPVSLAGGLGNLKTEAAITALTVRAHERLEMEHQQQH